MAQLFVIKNGALDKVGETETAPAPGDLLKRGAKLWEVKRRLFDVKNAENEAAYIIEEFNPLA
jgi:hypothetical protein